MTALSISGLRLFFHNLLTPFQTCCSATLGFCGRGRVSRLTLTELRQVIRTVLAHRDLDVVNASGRQGFIGTLHLGIHSVRLRFGTRLRHLGEIKQSAPLAIAAIEYVNVEHCAAASLRLRKKTQRERLHLRWPPSAR